MMQQLLVLNIPPELEDDLVDFLLTVPNLSGFTSYPVRGHGEHRQLSVAEQVTGRRRRIQFELILGASEIDTILGKLRSEVGTDIYFWQQAITRSGHV